MRKKLLIVPFVAAPLLWGLIRLQASHSEGFNFVRTKVTASPAVQSRIGMVDDVRLTLFGRYRAFSSDLRTEVHMDVDAIGSKGKVGIEVDVTESDGVWKVKHASIDGAPIALE